MTAGKAARRVAAASTVLLAASLIGPATPALASEARGAQAAELGGYVMFAEATPIALHIHESLIPIPAEPQLEFNLSYSRSKFSTGPTGHAVSSVFWPGDAIGYGLPEFLQNPDAKYPFIAEAKHPSGPEDAEEEYLPGTGMSSHADDATVHAEAAIFKPVLPGLPIPGLPVPPALIAVEGFSSESTTTVQDGKVVATSYATAGSITLLGGLVKLDKLKAEATASSDTNTGTADGQMSWGAITLAGTRFAADEEGVGTPIGVTPLPEVPDKVKERMARWGLSIDAPAVTKEVDGAAGKIAATGLTITLDTKVLRDRLSLGGLLDPLLALLPPELRDQISPWLQLAPKFVFILGNATAEAVATPAYNFDPPADDAPPAQDGGGWSGGGGSTPIISDLIPTPAQTQTPVAARQWPIFPAVPWYFIVLALALAAGASYGLRRYAAILFGTVGCELGLASGVPNLRK